MREMREIVLYFMRFEDKYWALFLAGLFLLFVLFLEEKDRKMRERICYVAGFGLFMHLLVFCPLAYDVVTRAFPALESYYETAHLIPCVTVLSFAATAVLLRLREEGFRRMVAMLLGLCLILSLAGDFAYIPFSEEQETYHCDKEEAQTLDMIIEHADSRGNTDTISIWGMEELMRKSPFYHTRFTPIYGKDISTDPEAYSEHIRSMRDGYEKYTRTENTGDDLRDYLDAIAGLWKLYDEVDCDYVIVYVPERQLERAGQEVTLQTEQACQAFEHAGFETVGSTRDKIVFCKKGNE